MLQVFVAAIHSLRKLARITPTTVSYTGAIPASTESNRKTLPK